MAKKTKPRGKTDARRTPEATPPREAEAAPKTGDEYAPRADINAGPKVEPRPSLSAPEGATKTEEEIAPELLPDGGRKIEPAAHRRREPEGADDRDLNIRGILGFMAGIFGLIGVAAVVSWGLYVYFRTDLRSMDPPPSPIPEANRAELPPEPRLRESPPQDMDALRAREDAVLTSYGWVDRGAGIGRIPIERAIDLAAEGKTAAKTEGDKP